MDKKRTIIYVDDDVDDRELFKEAMLKTDGIINIVYANNGAEALEIMDNDNDLTQSLCLIVLDLNMPFLSGREIFNIIKTKDTLRNIPVAILSSGQNPNDILFFKEQGVPYFTKPDRYSEIEILADNLFKLCKK